MPFRWHIHLPGPVAYSRPMRKRSGPGPLTAILIWFIVKPLELLVTGLVKLFAARSRSNTEHPVPLFGQPGWYHTVHGPLYFSGANWYAPDGRPLF